MLHVSKFMLNVGMPSSAQLIFKHCNQQEGIPIVLVNFVINVPTVNLLLTYQQNDKQIDQT